MSELLDLLLAGTDQPQADQPNSLAEVYGPCIQTLAGLLVGIAIGYNAGGDKGVTRATRVTREKKASVKTFDC
eukprot:478566-Pelagomonas_calceolata.AAC.1